MSTIQGIFEQFGEKFANIKKLGSVQQKAFKAIKQCRTAIMGELWRVCKDCGYKEIVYKSCRNRHCPQCQTYAKEKWINQRKADLINVRYFHVVFTIPAELAIITKLNRDKMFNILFKSVSETLKLLGQDKKWLGAEIGAMLILHTWTQIMLFHPHIHCLIPGGGLTSDGFWKYGKKKFFIPVRVLGKVFRGKFMHYFLQELNAGNLYLPGEYSLLQIDPIHLKAFKTQMYKKSWYVYCKRTFNGPEAVIEYLGRYTHRICISNHRIVNVSEAAPDESSDGSVTFTYRDNKDQGKQKEMTISGIEFIQRFMWHILPSGFMKIRYIGILSNRNKSTKLIHCQKLTDSYKRAQEFKLITNEMILAKVCGGKACVCPQCGGNNFGLAGNHPSILLNTG